MLLAEVIQESGLPNGVVNIVNGAGATGAAIVNHPDLNKIAFTGSTGVGKIIQRACAGTDKKVTLELGGKAANIIFEDAPIDQAVEGIVNGIYFNQGHVCCAGSRLFVQESVYEEVLRKLKHRMETLIVGDPLDKNTDVGAINSKEQLSTIKGFLKAGKAEGAEMFQNSCPLPSKGFWCPPTIFTNVAQSSRIVQEEIFGPVVTIMPFNSEDQVLQMANKVTYGLSATLWTNDLKRTMRMSNQLQVGIVWINTWMMRDLRTPFGGVKASGVGREGGFEALRFFTEAKNICIKY